jgi:hypothetical protein
MRHRRHAARAALLCATLISPGLAWAQQHGPDESASLIAKLPQSKHSLLDGIREAEKANGPAISAKLEMKNNQLLLSVYTAKQGRDHDAEHNTLMELIGDATAAQWQPKTEVFEDKAHIARSAMHLTLLQMTNLSLADLVQKAGALRKGTVYSAIPAVKGGQPVVTVLVATPDGKSETLALDVRTGQVR